MVEYEGLTKKQRKALARKEKAQQREKEESANRAKKWFSWILILIFVGFGGYKFVTWLNTPTDLPEVSIDLTDSDWVKGSPEATNTLVEYGDFQCPACSQYQPVVKRLAEETNVRIVFRHFPLTSIQSPETMLNLSITLEGILAIPLSISSCSDSAISKVIIFLSSGLLGFIILFFIKTYF